MELRCFRRNAMHRIDAAGTQYELMILVSDREALDEFAYALLDDMHGWGRWMLYEGSSRPTTDAYWE